ncbi:Tenascin-X [Myotis davidii]|uniref:Tenascin-X n=1 Tax=Myotis davidii TaxID=225400 RepID=L5LAQ1_MYODS|nr:Tenascin-X [Myotis davidii]
MGGRQGQQEGVGSTAAQEVVEETPSSTEPSTEAPQPPEEPLLGELTVTGSSPDSLSLSWTVPRGHFDAFTVQYKDRDGRPQVVRVGGEESEVTVRGLEPGRKYKMHLYGLHGGRRVGPASTLGLTAPKAEPPAGPPVKPRLGELTVTGSSPDSLSLSWTVPQGQFDHFLVQYKNGDGQPKAVRVPGHEDGVTISGLEPDHKYKMHLYGFHDGQRQGPASVTGVTATLPSEPPVAPRLEELAVAAVTSDSVLLSWTVAQGPFDSFLVQYRDEQGQPQAVPVGGDLREVTVSGLAPARKYKFLLFGVQGAKRHGPLSADAKTLPDTQPPRLGELTVTGVTPDSVGLAWTVPQGKFDSFKVQYKDRHGQSRVVPVAADQREATVGGLEPHRKYRFLLYGLAGGRQLGPVPPEGTTAPEEDTPAPWQVATGAPDTPGGPRLGELAVTDSTPDSLHLAWTVARGPFDSFVVQYWDADGSPLGPSTAYKFFLYGLHEGKRLGPVSMEGTTGSAPAGQTPGGPGPRLSQLSVTDVTTSSLRLNWEAPPGAFDSFLLRYGVPSASTPGPHPRPPLQREVTVPGTQLSAVLRDLRPGTLYSLTLYGFPGPHQADSVQGQAWLLESPRDLQFSDIGETSAKVSWTPPPSRADSFKVSYQLVDGGEPQSVLVGGRARTQQLGGLVPGAHYEGLELHTNYTATVHGLRGPNLTSPASIVFTTGLEGPRDLEAKEVTPRTALLTWTEPQVLPTGYLLTYDTPDGQTQVPFPRDCGEEMQNGAGTSRTTTIFLNGNRARPLDVFCDMETDGGGWLVFQRRMDGRTDFWRDWEDYAHGFGNISGEFWLGNEALHSLTSHGDYSMRVDLRAGGEMAFAQYDSFRVDSAADYYRLHLEGYHGTAGDSMSYHSGSVFSARDRDPNNLLISCAVSYRGAWWYRNCHYANLNGLYGSTVDHQVRPWLADRRAGSY